MAEVIESGTAEAELEGLSAAEDKAEAALGFDHVLEVYAPIRNRYGRVVGAFEIYADSSALEASIADRKRTLWLSTAVVFALVALLLWFLVRGASTALRRQTETVRQRSKALMESYALLEESSLEAIESLNATVEAKDPYTAGHSLRVKRIAVALGQELGLDKPRIDALRFGALFHDIGKLAVPDAVLKKPSLTKEEYEVVKAHSSDGAHIVGKFSRLRESVPIIEHHHERWDGSGYPAGLANEDIPLEAAIVGLADAWDAMTTIGRTTERSRSTRPARNPERQRHTVRAQSRRRVLRHAQAPAGRALRGGRAPLGAADRGSLLNATAQEKEDEQ